MLDGMVFYQPTEVTDAFKAATEHYVQHRFEPKLKVDQLLFKGLLLVRSGSGWRAGRRETCMQPGPAVGTDNRTLRLGCCLQLSACLHACALLAGGEEVAGLG